MDGQEQVESRTIWMYTHTRITNYSRVTWCWVDNGGTIWVLRDRWKIRV